MGKCISTQKYSLYNIKLCSLITAVARSTRAPVHNDLRATDVSGCGLDDGAGSDDLRAAAAAECENCREKHNQDGLHRDLGGRASSACEWRWSLYSCSFRPTFYVSRLLPRRCMVQRHRVHSLRTSPRVVARGLTYSTLPSLSAMHTHFRSSLLLVICMEIEFPYIVCRQCSVIHDDIRE